MKNGKFKKVREWHHHDCAIISLHIIDDLYVSGDTNGRVTIQSIYENTELLNIKEEYPIMSIELSQDTKWLLIGGINNKASLYNAFTGIKVREFAGKDRSYVVNSVTFSQGKNIAGKSDDEQKTN